MSNQNATHFPKEIDLNKNPLIEAWIEIKWDLIPSDIPGFFFDKQFPFALGIFYKNVEERYPFIEELETSKTPEGMVPNLPQYRFRVRETGYPLLQLGPGIATVNFNNSYSWDEFKNEIIYLQDQLLTAYKSTNLYINTISLHYRNSYPFEFSNENLLDFLADNLNTHIVLPKHIPGNVSETAYPITTRLDFNFNIINPSSICTIRYGTGYQKNKNGEKQDKSEIFLWEFGLLAGKNQVPDIYNKDSFSNWLEKAHAVIHEWFFSTIDGKLFSEFNKE